VFIGQGEFTGKDKLEVGGKTLHFKKAVVATGARASAPPIPGLDDVDYLTNESVFSLTERPARLGVIGAGPIGCELAQSFSRLGSEVLLIEATDGILPREDQDAAAIVQDAMAKDGVKLLCSGKDLTLSKADGGGVRLKVISHGESYDEVIDKLMVAVGRAPNVEGLGLETAGVEYSKKGVVVDDFFRTTNPNIFAAGDICSPYQFTHAADFMARAVIQNALFFGRSKASSLTIPWATYTSPEIAHVGLYEKEAKDKGVETDTYNQPLTGVDRAILEGETEGFVSVLVKKGTDEILGATVVATNAGDMISEITIAMTQKIGLKKLSGVIHPYPTQAEAVRKVGDLFNRTRLTPTVKNLFNKWLAWLRR